jgi:hypothetical protein
MKRLAEILAEVDRLAHEPDRDPEVQRRAFDAVLKVFTEHQGRFHDVWDDIATQKITPCITYLLRKVEALG